MPEEKKPKIDLKARLGKTSAQTPPPAGVVPVSAPQMTPSGIPVPMRSAGSGAPQAMPGVPVGPPPAFGSQPPRIDPSNPLAAVAAPYRPAPAAAPAPQLQRIEVDEMAVQTAAKGARKQGIIIGCVLAAVVAPIGYVAGSSAQQGSDRSKSHNDAKELSDDVAKARDSLKGLADKVEAGIKAIHDEHKFPDALAKDLGGINVDFDGTKLAGRRFSGFPAETAHDLVEFITSVQAVNDRKELIQGLLTQLQKPITEQLSVPAGQANVSFVVAVAKDPSGNLAGFLSALSKPITVTRDNINLPAKLQFADPGGGNAEAPRYTGGDISKDHSVIYVVPKSFEAACPSGKGGQVTQLAAQMGNFVHDIRGDKQAAGDQDIVQDSKPGLTERADKLVAALGKVN